MGFNKTSLRAAAAGGGLLLLAVRLRHDDDIQDVRAEQHGRPATFGSVRLSERVEVVRFAGESGCLREKQWDVFIADMATAAHAGAIRENKCEAWLTNVHVASSSAEAARTVVHVEEEEEEEEPTYFFYLRSIKGGAHQGCMQVRIVDNVAIIDALCSLGNRGGQAFMSYLVDWLPTVAPCVERIELLPLSNGWLRKDYYAGLGFVDNPDGRVMTRGLGRTGTEAACMDVCLEGDEATSVIARVAFRIVESGERR